MIDFEKALRQIKHARKQTKSAERCGLLDSLAVVYVNMKHARQRDIALAALGSFDKKAAETFGWRPDTGSGMPRPFSHPHLEQLYWQAHKNLRGKGQPRRVYRPQPKVSLNGWRED